MLKFLSKLLGGSKSEKDIAAVKPYVEKINSFYQQYATLDNDALRGKTHYFRDIIKQQLSAIDQQIEARQQAADAVPAAQVHEKDAIYKEIDKLKKDRDKQLEEALEKILPEAFAVVKETARRFSANETLVAKATDLDKELARTKPYIKIIGDEASFQNSWMAGGNKIVWNMVHYDVQLMGGAVLHSGKIAEMGTGEGKTLVSTLPAYLNALAGEGVHIVTVNDYLAKRDSEWNGTLFEWLGLTVDCIDKHQPNSPERRKAYQADITYGTNNEFGFDYLRDNMVHTPEEMVQRKHHYAMVDEVDSVLIDDARTPLIISGPTERQESVQQFFDLKPRVEKIVEAQKRAVNNFLNEAKKKIAEGNDEPKDGGGLALYRAFRGMPKNKAVIKYLSEPGIKVKLQKAENYFLADQSKEMPLVDAELFFYIDEKNNSVELTDKGIQLITKEGEDPNFFIIPDISTQLAEVEKTQGSAEDKLHRKESVINEYSVKTDRIHTINQLLKAYTLFNKDDEYVVMDGAVKIVDEQTGRILEGRRYSDGLHQAIEAKENVNIEATTQTYATITLQNYFRMYHKLCGMTGTAETEAGEFWDIYKLDVVSVPTNIPVIRVDGQDSIYKTKREKYGAVIESIEKLRNSGRPVLVGTTSIEVSELLSRMLRQKQIPHNVLNAKQHAREAQVIAEAGLSGAVTIATNMAGRGTDIKLGPGVKEAGGLAIIGTERHESRRVDRQLRGRAGRQGDPGSSEFYVSLEDDLMRMFGSERIAKVMDFAGYKEGEVIQHNMVTKSIERAQKKVEENNFGVRKRLLEYDDVMNKQRTVIYTKRNHALFGERLALDLDNAFYFVADSIAKNHKEDHEGFKLASFINLGMETAISQDTINKSDAPTLAEQLYREAMSAYQYKRSEISANAVEVFQAILHEQGSRVENVVVPFTDGRKGISVVSPINKTIESNGEELIRSLEKTVTLNCIDEEWKEHLRAMDDLKHSVQTATYEQKDPLVVYKGKAFEMFVAMDATVNRNIVSFLSHCSIPVEENQPRNVVATKQPLIEKQDLSKLKTKKQELDGAGNEISYDKEENGDTASQDPAPKLQPFIAGPKIGRNDPCPCGSGKKYKACHGRDA